MSDPVQLGDIFEYLDTLNTENKQLKAETERLTKEKAALWNELVTLRRRVTGMES